MQNRVRNVFSTRSQITIRPELGGMRIPAEIQKRFSDPDDEPDVLEIKPVEKKLKESLLADVPFFRLAITPQHPRGVIIDTYLDSVQIVESAADGFESFFEQLIVSLVWLRLPKDRKCRSYRQAVDELCEVIRNQLRFAMRTTPVVITADLAAAGNAALFEAAREDLQKRIAALGSHIRRVLHDGVYAGVLGVISWLKTDTCRLFHCRLNVCLEDVARERVSFTKLNVTETWVHRIAAHELHLIDATLFRGVPYWLQLPKFAEGVLSALPRFLMPVVSTVDGTMIRERIIAWDLFHTEHSHEEEIPVPRSTADPGILIGNVVLMGWTQRELPTPHDERMSASQQIWRFCDYVQSGFRKNEPA